jgi:cytidylate kinase
MYRAVTLAALEENPNLGEREVKALLKRLDLALGENGEILLQGRCVDDRLREDLVTNAVSTVSALPAVRRYLVRMQRDFARKGALVAEGRDLGSIVFPDAAFKFYLDASPEERARRRARQHQDRGEAALQEKVLADQARRDRLDSERAVSPLTVTDEMIRIDTTSLSAEEVVNLMVNRINSV